MQGLKRVQENVHPEETGEGCTRPNDLNIMFNVLQEEHEEQKEQKVSKVVDMN